MTDQTGLVPTLVWVVVPQLPLLATYLVGICIAVRSWRLHPKSSALILIGCGVLLMHFLVIGTIAAMLPSLMHERGWSNSHITSAFHALNFFRSVISSIGIGCLLGAAIVRRAT